MTLDELEVIIKANTKPLEDGLKGIRSDLKRFDNIGSKATRNVTKGFSKLKQAIVATALAVGVASKLLKNVLKEGVDAIESESLVNVVFGESVEDIRNWSKELSNALGLNEFQVRKQAADFFNLSRSLGATQEQALTVAKGFGALSQDFASFRNLSLEESFIKLSAGLSGEIEPLRRQGALIDEATSRQIAFEKGITSTNRELTNQEKILARYEGILKQTVSAHGDLARTINTPANQIRRLGASFDLLKIQLSQFILPVFNQVVIYINAIVIVVRRLIQTIAQFFGKELPVPDPEDVDYSGISGDLKDANKEAKKLKNSLAGFDEMNVVTQSSSQGGDAVGGGINPFELTEYNAGLDNINDKVTQIVEGWKARFNSLKETIKGAFGVDSLDGFFTSFQTYVSPFKSLLKTVGNSIWTNLGNIWTNIEPKFLSFSESIKQLLISLTPSFFEVITSFSDALGEIIDTSLTTISEEIITPVLELMLGATTDILDSIREEWDKSGGGIVSQVKEFIEKIKNIYLGIQEKVIDAIIKPALEWLQQIWDEHIADLVPKVTEFISKLVELFLFILNKGIIPLVSFLIDIFFPIFKFVFKTILSVLKPIIGIIVSLIGGIFDILSGVIDFVLGVFTGDWRRAWDGIKGIFTGIWDSLKGIAEGVLNGIIALINGLINGFNAVDFLNVIPDIPTIPDVHLAKGGVVDRPTNAIIGESGREAVVPLERNTEWLDMLAEKIGSGGGEGMNLTIMLGEDTIFDKVIDKINDRDFQENGGVIAV